MGVDEARLASDLLKTIVSDDLYLRRARHPQGTNSRLISIL